MITCLHCGAETSNGLALCDLCRRAAETYLDFIPVYFGNLARWKPGRSGTRQVPGSRVLWDGSERGQGDRIGAALDEAKNMLVTRIRELAHDRPAFDVPAETETDAATVVILCTALRDHLVSISTLDWCGDLVTDLGEHEARLRSLTEALVPGWYAGACRHCDAPTYVVPGLTWVTCRVCGSTTYARDHLDTILDEACGWVARPMRLAEAIVALVDTEQSVTRLHERVKKWAQRDRLTPIRRTERSLTFVLDEDDEIVARWAEVEAGHPRYRLGEVLALVYAEGATRGADTTASA